MAEYRSRLSREERDENILAQREELEALEAIYGDNFKVLIPVREDIHPPTPSRGSAADLPHISLRVSETPLVSLHLRLPEGYPSHEFPSHKIIAPGLSHAAQNRLSWALRPPQHGEGDDSGDATDSPPGAVVVFDWAETLRGLVSEAYDTENHEDPASPYDSDKSGAALAFNHEKQEQSNRKFFRGDGKEVLGQEDYGGGVEIEEPDDSVEIVHGEAFTDRKSTFQAHLARVSTERQVEWTRRRLMENSKIARATHNVAAWRIWDRSRGVQLHDNDDDGESAAGSRLAHMLAITGAQNVLVVVSRWYGGIHLGPDRFKHINNAARELLVKYGATNSASDAAASAGRSTTNPSTSGGGKSKGRRRRGSGGGGT